MLARLSPITASDRKKDRKSTRLNSSHSQISYAVFCLKKKKKLCLFPASPHEVAQTDLHPIVDGFFQTQAGLDRAFVVPGFGDADPIPTATDLVCAPHY